MFPHLGRFVFGIEDSELREHTHMSPLEAQGSLKERYELIKVAPVLIIVDEVSQLIGVNNNMETTDLSQTELTCINARKANLHEHNTCNTCNTCKVHSIIVYTCNTLYVVYNVHECMHASTHN